MQTTNWAISAANQGADKLRELIDDAIHAIVHGYREDELWYRLICVISSPEIAPCDVYSLMEAYIVNGRHAIKPTLERIRAIA